MYWYDFSYLESRIELLRTGFFTLPLLYFIEDLQTPCKYYFTKGASSSDIMVKSFYKNIWRSFFFHMRNKFSKTSQEFPNLADPVKPYLTKSRWPTNIFQLSPFRLGLRHSPPPLSYLLLSNVSFMLAIWLLALAVWCQEGMFVYSNGEKKWDFIFFKSTDSHQT